mgnify:CR=1 FL=1
MGFVTAVVTGGIATPLVVAGPVFGALIGATTGTALGSIVGGLLEAGLSEDEARAIQSDAEAGGLVIIARVPEGHEERVREILLRDGGGVTPGSPPPVKAP